MHYVTLASLQGSENFDTSCPHNFFLRIFNYLLSYLLWPGLCQNTDSYINHFLFVVCKLFSFWESWSLPLPLCCILSVKHVVNESVKSLKQSGLWKVVCSVAVQCRLFLAGEAHLSFLFLSCSSILSYRYGRLFAYPVKSRLWRLFKKLERVWRL